VVGDEAFFDLQVRFSGQNDRDLISEPSGHFRKGFPAEKEIFALREFPEMSGVPGQMPGDASIAGSNAAVSVHR